MKKLLSFGKWSENFIVKFTADENTPLIIKPSLCFLIAASSSEIHSALKDENLQKLISSIDCSPDAEKVSSNIYLNRDTKVCSLSNIFYVDVILVLKPDCPRLKWRTLFANCDLYYYQELEKAMGVDVFRVFTDKVIPSITALLQNNILLVLYIYEMYWVAIRPSTVHMNNLLFGFMSSDPVYHRDIFVFSKCKHMKILCCHLDLLPLVSSPSLAEEFCNWVQS